MMSGMTTDQAERMIATIRELDGRLWAGVLIRVINDLELESKVWDFIGYHVQVQEGDNSGQGD